MEKEERHKLDSVTLGIEHEDVKIYETNQRDFNPFVNWLVHDQRIGTDSVVTRACPQ